MRRVAATRLASRWGAVLLLFGAGCGSAAPVEVPAEVRGRWVTDDSRFAGRALELSTASVRFETGIEAPAVHAVRAVESRVSSNDERQIVISYVGEGDLEYEMRLAYRPDVDELRLVNRPEVVWKRGGGP